MGPVAIFDKSFLQSLSLDESVWFDQYFLPIITPLFFIETLADLEKTHLQPDRTAEDEVRIIAQKTPQLSSSPNVHHVTLCEGEFHGYPAPMQRKPILGGGTRFVSDGKIGYSFGVTPEAEALQRWREEKFHEVERMYARAWRAGLQAPESLPGEDYLQWQRKGLAECKSLPEVRELAAKVVSGRNGTAYERMKFVFDVLGIRKNRQALAQRFEALGAPSFREYAPYTAHVLEVEIFFRFAQERGLISRDRPSHRVDIAYLNYLPFCNVFISNDRLHAATVPLFLRDKQAYIPGVELKADLRRINERNLLVPLEQREKGIMSFAPKPPTKGTFLTSQLWDKFVGPRWRTAESLKLTPEQEKKLLDHVRKMKPGDGSRPPPSGASLDEADALRIERRVGRVRGSWYQMPKDLKD